jgi:hypothetical protein
VYINQNIDNDRLSREQKNLLSAKDHMNNPSSYITMECRIFNTPHKKAETIKTGIYEKKELML